MFRHWTRAGLFVLAFATFALPALAQSSGSIGGTVRDPSGAAVPGATLTVTNQATNASKVFTTAADGAYTASLDPGVYSVSVSLKGFGKQTQKDLKVVAGATVTADFTLQTRLEESITVTAMKREETIQNTPFSVAAPSGADLAARGVDDIEGVSRTVAGFSVQNLGPGQSQVAMRGISSGQIARDQPGVKEQVGAYLDESVISLSLFTPDIDLFDISRVEVLRGPQGTLFGSGSESGTIRYITNQPELGATKYFGELGANSVDGGNQGASVKLGANAPLGDKAAFRVAAYYNRLAGYMDAVQPDLSIKEDVNTGKRFGVRATVKIVPNDKLTITPRFVYQKVDMDGWNRMDAFNILANPFTTTRPAVNLGDLQLFTQTGEPFTDKFALGDLAIGYNFGNVTLTSVTSYAYRDVLVVRDATALTASITGGTIALPENVFAIDAPLDDATTAKVWTQELRFSGGNDQLKWLAGGFYASTTRDYGQSLLVAGFEDLTGIPTAGRFGAGKDVLFFSDLHYELNQFALFGEGTYSLNDQMSVTGGLRFYHFKEERTQVFDGIFADPASKPGTIDANGIAPRLIVTYKVNDNTNVNVQASKGFRLGGINDQLNVPLCTPEDLVTFGGRDTWEDETAWNYEVGSKSRIMGGRGSFNASAFYVDIRNLQATLTAGTCSSRVIFNVPKARSLGAEVEFAAAPNDHFDFAISAAVNSSQLRTTLTSGGSVLAGIRDGNRLPSVPEFQMTAAATYQREVMGNARGYLTGSFQHVGSRFTQVGDEEPGFGTVNLLTFPGTIGGPLTQGTFSFNPELPAYDIMNVRVGVAKGRWDVALYVNNLTDERAFLALDRERGLRARVGFLINQPRTLGLTARFNF